MSELKDKKELLDSIVKNYFESIVDLNVYLLNSKLKHIKVKIFHQNVSDKVRGDYVSNMKKFCCRDIFEYNVDVIDKECIQYISTDELSTWVLIKQAIESINIINTPRLDAKDINANDNTIVLEYKCEVEDQLKKIFFIAKYKPLSSWFKTGHRFLAKNFEEQKEEIVILPGNIDAIIFDDSCYILQENNFDYIFAFNEKLNKKINDNRNDILNWQFLDNAEEFYNMCTSGVRIKRALNKALDLKNIEALKTSEPLVIRDRIKEYPSVYEKLHFDNENKLIVTEDSTKLFLDILRNRVGVSLLTGEVFND